MQNISPIRKQLALSPGSAQSTQCLGLGVEVRGCRLPSFPSQDRDLRAWEDPSLNVKLPGGTKQKLLPLLLCSAHLSLWGSLIVVFELSANILKTKTDLPWNAKPGFPFLQIEQVLERWLEVNPPGPCGERKELTPAS